MQSRCPMSKLLGSTRSLARCKMKPYCLNCQGEHGPTNRKCPVYLAEKEISRIRVTKGVSYSEANKQFNAGGGSYAEVSKIQRRLKINENNDVASLIKEKDEIIKKMMDTVAKLTSRIEELEQKKKDKNMKKQLNREQKKTTTEEIDLDMDTVSSLQAAEMNKVSDNSSKVNDRLLSNAKVTHKRHPTTEITPPSVKKASEEMTVEVDRFLNPAYSSNSDSSF